MKITLVLLALAVCTLSYEFSKPKNGSELEETLRSELDDIWVIEWYQNQKGKVNCAEQKTDATAQGCKCTQNAQTKDWTCTDAPAAPAAADKNAAANQNAQPGAAKPEDPNVVAKRINDLNSNVLNLLQKQCPTLSKEYKFTSVDLDAEKQ